MKRIIIIILAILTMSIIMSACQTTPADYHNEKAASNDIVMTTKVINEVASKHIAPTTNMATVSTAETASNIETTNTPREEETCPVTTEPESFTQDYMVYELLKSQSTEEQKLGIQHLLEITRTSPEPMSEWGFILIVSDNSLVDETVTTAILQEARSNVLDNVNFSFFDKYWCFLNSTDKQVSSMALDRLMDITKTALKNEDGETLYDVFNVVAHCGNSQEDLTKLRALLPPM